MAIIVKYVVVVDGRDEMTFSTRKEAEAHDKMLAIAERLYAYLQTADLNIADDTLDALSIFLAQHREQVGTILKGGKLKPSAVSAQPAVVSRGVKDAATSTPKRSKSSPSAPPTPPQAAA